MNLLWATGSSGLLVSMLQHMVLAYLFGKLRDSYKSLVPVSFFCVFSLPQANVLSVSRSANYKQKDMADP